jgi:hypothetical protein
VQCDGYAAYKKVAHEACGEATTLAFCWAHLRRKFFDIAKDGPAPIASEALERIAKLYAIEKTIRGQSADERLLVRQQRSKPLAHDLRTWFEHQLTRVSGKSLIADAIRYALNHWDGLTRFLEDGRIELDTNVVERSIRPIVLNRKKRSSPAMIRDRRTGLASLLSSRPANCTASIREPTSPNCSAHLSSRRADALDLGGGAPDKQTRGVTRRALSKKSCGCAQGGRGRLTLYNQVY